MVDAEIERITPQSSDSGPLRFPIEETRRLGGRASAVFALSGRGDLRARLPEFPAESQAPARDAP